MMLLSSYERARRFLCVEDNTKNRRVINQYLYAISSNIEAYLDRKFERKSRTEFFNTELGLREFWMEAPEISSITSVDVDATGEFNGSETPLTTSFIGRNSNSIVLQYSQFPAKRGLRIVYVGGASTTTSISTYTLSSIMGSFSVGQFLEGDLSGAFGIIKSFNTVLKIMTVDVLYGVFKEGESLSKRDTEDAGITLNVSATLATVDVVSFVEAHPEIATAVETQIRYNVKTKDDFENTAVSKSKVSRRKPNLIIDVQGSHSFQDLQPETRSLINGFKRHVFY